MLYLKRLVSDLCSTVQDDKSKIMKHVFIKPNQQGMSDNKENEDIVNDVTCFNLQKVKNKCKMLQQSQKGPKTTTLKPEGDKKMLLLDLDKTIIYFTEKQGFKVRPHLKQFLKAVEPYYSIFIFTASTQSYLQQMVQNLSENECGKQYFSGFLARENCIVLPMGHHRAIYVKDIKIFTNCDISKIVVVDDTPITYCLNPDNAVPILPYFGENLDNHLLFLAKTLRQIKDYDDVRDYIRDRYTFNFIVRQTLSNDQSYSSKAVSPIKQKFTVKRHKSS